MSMSKQPVIKVTELASICIIVRDIDKSMASMWNTFGIGPWDVFIRDFNSTSDAVSVRDMTYYGRPAQFGWKVALLHNKPGSMGIELIQPTEGDSIYSEFLKVHGEGIQHIGWYLVNSMESFHETKQMLEQAGFPCIQSSRSDTSADAYFDTEKILHTTLQILFREPLKYQSRQPNYVFP